MTGREQDETSAEKLRGVADDAGVESGVLESGVVDSGAADADVPPDSSGYSAPPLDS